MYGVQSKAGKVERLREMYGNGSGAFVMKGR